LTEYDVPDAALMGRSRKLRCDKCEHSWKTEVLTPEQVAAMAGMGTPAVAVPPPVMPAAPVMPVMPVMQSAPLPEVAPLPPVARPAPAPEQERWPAYADDVPGWSEEEIAGDRTLRISPAAARRFGQPADPAALAEVMAAVSQEQKGGPPPAESFGMPVQPPAPQAPSIGDALPAFLTAERGVDTVMVSEPESDDRFAELVYAARNKAIEYEPEPPPPPPPVRTSNKPMFISLLVAFVVAFVLVEHQNVITLLPSTRGFFMTLGLK